MNADERNRTSTPCYGHKNLNLARLPVPPHPLSGTGMIAAASGPANVSHGRDCTGSIQCATLDRDKLGKNVIHVSATLQSVRWTQCQRRFAC